MIYLDLDGVFANFDKAVLDRTGFSYESDPKSAWPVLDKIPNFFATLEPLPGAHVMFGHIANLALMHGETMAILTALPMLTNELSTAEKDKKDWVAKYLDPDIDVICVSNWSRKAEFAYDGNILIDDSARNIRSWCEQGGIGILHHSAYPNATTRSLAAFLQLGTEY